MHVGYQGANGSRSVYLCNPRQIHYGEPKCQHVPGAAVDRFVLEHLLAALTPAQIELSLAAVAELERQQAEVARQWQRRLEAAHYAAALAQRRYEAVDPANRLVARTLEQQWEAGLAEIERVNTDFAALQHEKPLSISASQRQALLTLAADLEKVWAAPTTTWQERKDLVQLLIADVTLTRSDTTITVQIRWFTDAVETGQIPLPIKSGIPTAAAAIERIGRLFNSHTDQEIATILNQEGFKPVRGSYFNAHMVEGIRLRQRYVQTLCHSSSIIPPWRVYYVRASGAQPERRSRDGVAGQRRWMLPSSDPNWNSWPNRPSGEQVIGGCPQRCKLGVAGAPLQVATRSPTHFSAQLNRWSPCDRMRAIQTPVVQPMPVPTQFPCASKCVSNNSGIPIPSICVNNRGISSTRSVTILSAFVMHTAYRNLIISPFFDRTVSRLQHLFYIFGGFRSPKNQGITALFAFSHTKDVSVGCHPPSKP